jgi:hypothetical protein
MEKSKDVVDAAPELMRRHAFGKLWSSLHLRNRRDGRCLGPKIMERLEVVPPTPVFYLLISDSDFRLRLAPLAKKHGVHCFQHDHRVEL